jgi:polyhydroxyalkanoate synthesis repressor PhaR
MAVLLGPAQPGFSLTIKAGAGDVKDFFCNVKYFNLLPLPFIKDIFASCKNLSYTDSQKEKTAVAEKVLLKKYANRRLYDTHQSAFVSLSQVGEMIKQGREIEIRDDKTGEDVTAFILTQIVLEEVKKKTLLLPVSFLSLLIRYGDSALSDFFDKYLEQILRNYLAYKSAMDDQFQKWLELGQDFSQLTQKAMADLTPGAPGWIFSPARGGKKARRKGRGVDRAAAARPLISHNGPNHISSSA